MTSAPAGDHSSKHVDIALLAVTCVLLTALMLLLAWVLRAQLDNYTAAINRELKQSEIDHAVILAYSRSWDFAVVKTGGLFLGFMQVLLGAMYLLKTASVSYSLGVEQERIGKATLATSSPGLVMMTLGVATIALVLYSKSDVSYTAPSFRSAPATKTPADIVVTPSD
jgi:hypothetical protein